MIPFAGAVEAFAVIFSFVPAPVQLFITTMICLNLGINFILWLLDKFFS